MFAMFFGSGNLVFPLAIGTETTSQVIYAMLGLFVTAICVPFLGLLAMILFEGKRELAFSYIGKWPAFLLSFAMLSLMGPFGVAARCIIVAHGGISQLMPSLSLEVFGGVWCLITAAIILSRSSWINLIGKYLTPLLLLSIFSIIVAGFIQAPSISSSNIDAYNSFKIGLSEGYQTMDLLAAFFFSITIVSFLQGNLGKNGVKQPLKTSLMASLVGAGLLALVYVGFMLLGAFYATDLIAIAPEKRLAFVALATLGKPAMWIVATAVALACFTTFVVLIVLFAAFLTENVSKNKLPYNYAVIITLLISFIVSLIGFSALAAWIAGALQVAYPALIAFAIALIAHKTIKVDIIAWSFWGTLALTAGYYIFF